jgi:hypothetical protein
LKHRNLGKGGGIPEAAKLKNAAPWLSIRWRSGMNAGGKLHEIRDFRAGRGGRAAVRLRLRRGAKAGAVHIDVNAQAMVVPSWSCIALPGRFIRKPACR